jgi:peptidylprolyl isomerase
LEDGNLFDSSYENRRPFSFRVGSGDVIKGWDEAVRSMKIGSRRVIIVPPALGYGAAGAGGGRIPGGASLIFFLELLSVGP